MTLGNEGNAPLGDDEQKILDLITEGLSDEKRLSRSLVAFKKVSVRTRIADTLWRKRTPAGKFGIGMGIFTSVMGGFGVAFRNVAPPNRRDIINIYKEAFNVAKNYSSHPPTVGTVLMGVAAFTGVLAAGLGAGCVVASQMRKRRAAQNATNNRPS